MCQKDGEEETPDDKLREMARRLTRKIPAGKFTATAIQSNFLMKAHDPTGALLEVDDWVKLELQRRNQWKDASVEEVSTDENVPSDKGKARAEARTSTEDEVQSVFDRMDPSNLSFTEELAKPAAKDPSALDLDIEKAKTNAPRKQDPAQRRARITPSSAISPQDAVGMRPLSAYSF